MEFYGNHREIWHMIVVRRSQSAAVGDVLQHIDVLYLSTFTSHDNLDYFPLFRVNKEFPGMTSNMASAGIFGHVQYSL
jgi:hypothetical protein